MAIRAGQGQDFNAPAETAQTRFFNNPSQNHGYRRQDQQSRDYHGHHHGPEFVISGSVSGLTDTSSETLTITSLGRDAGKHSRVAIYDGKQFLGDATANADGGWSFSLGNLKDGVHDFYAVITQANGESSVTSVVRDKVSTQTPTAALNESVSGLSTSTSDVITVSATAEQVSGNHIASVGIYDNGNFLGDATAAGNGNWTYTANDLAVGNHNFSAVVTDAAGNTASAAAANTDVVYAVPPASSESALFTAYDGAVGSNLVYGTDASSGNTVMLTDAAGNPLIESSGFTALGNGQAVFSAMDAVTGQAGTYISNGTEAGTYLLTDANGNALQQAGNFISLGNGSFIFSANDTATGIGVYISNGASAGTYQVTDSSDNPLEAPYSFSSYEEINSLWNGVAMLNGYDPVLNQYQEYLANSSQTGVFQLTDPSGNPYPNLSFIASLGNREGIFLSYNPTTTQYSLLLSNGTSTGTFVLSNQAGEYDVNSYDHAAILKQLNNGTEIFTIYGYSQSLGYDFFSNGAQAGTFSLVDSNGNPLTGVSDITSMANGSVIFLTQSDYGQIYISNGAQAGAVALTDASGNPFEKVTSLMQLANGSAIFLADSSSYSGGVYISDGAQAGTVALTDASGNPLQDVSGLTELPNGSVIFWASHAGVWGVYVSNGAQAGTFELTGANGNAFQNTTQYAAGFDVLNNGLVAFFAGNSSPYSMVVSDGTQAGTFQLTDASGNVLTNVANLTLLGNGDIIFNAGYDVYVNNGKQSGSIELTDAAGNPLSNLYGFTSLGNEAVIFSAADAVTGANGVFVSNGSQTGTFQVTDLAGNAVFADSGFTSLADNRVIFSGYDAVTYINGVYISNGTQAGTVQLTDAAGNALVNPGGFTSLINNTVIFTAADAVTGISGVYISNGAQAGTFQLTDAAGNAIQNLSGFTAFGNNAEIFSAKDAVSGAALLFITDGTQAGSFQLIDAAGNAVNNASDFTSLGNGVELFSAADSVAGLTYQFISNGAQAGTFELTDAGGNALSSVTVAANLSNGGVVLSAFDAALNQWQTWISNGTKAGTFEVTDAAGNPIQFTGLDTSLSGKLLFNASDAASGNQVWVTDGTQQGTMLLKDINSGFAEGFAYSSAFTLNNNLILLDAAGVNTPQDNLWLYNQTTAGYQQLTDTTGHALQSASDFTMLTSGAELFYAFDTGTNSWGNFITNGGAAVAFALIDSAGNEVRQDGGIAGDGFEVLTVYDPLNSLYYEFVSNGSQANTFQLGSGDNIYNPLYNVTNLTNGSLMFLAYGTAAGVNYISNGTRMGTFALTDASGNVLGASDESAALHNGSVIFSANDPVSNINGIFIDNGSQAKALQLTDVSGNVLEYVYSYYTALGNNSVIFNAIDSSTGQVSLYISNGSQAATSQLLDSSGNTLINAGEANAINGSVMFMAEDSVTRQTGLYITDGSQAGTLELLGADDSFFTVSALVSGSEIITIGNDPEWQPQTFISNGTPSGTFELKDSGGNSVSSPSLVSLGNGLELITAQDAINNQFQYFISNGSKAGTFQLASENAAPNHETALSNGTVIFAGYQYDIYASNGAQAGTFQLTDSKGQALTATSGFTNLDNAATIFAASDLTVSPYLELTGTGVYVSNGAQSVPLELTVDGNELSSAANFTAVGNGSVIFTANGLTTQISSGGAINYNYGTVDFISNGTQAGTFGLTDASGNALQNTTSFTSLANGGVIFSADDAATGAGVFVSDGSQAQALQLTDAAGHDLDTGNSGFISVGNGEVLFSATDAVTGREATYLSNGAQAGTFQFTDANGVAINGVSNVKVIGNGEFIFNFSYSSDPNPVSLSGGLSANGTIISVGGGNNASSSTEVGISDGAIAGTHILPAPGTASSNPGSFEPLTDNLTLTGTSSNYELIGGSGNDTLTSGVGHDVMYGGGGANSFVFGAGITPGADDFAYIMDYSDSQGDIINLSNVFTGQQPNSADIGNFVELVNNGGIVDIYVDATGGGNFTGHEVFELVNNASNNPIGLVGVQIAGQEFSLTA